MEKIKIENSELSLELDRVKCFSSSSDGLLHEIKEKLENSERKAEEEKKEKIQANETMKISQKQQKIQLHRILLLEENVKERDQEGLNLRKAVVELEEACMKAKQNARKNKILMAIVIIVGVFYGVLERWIEIITQGQTYQYG